MASDCQQARTMKISFYKELNYLQLPDYTVKKPCTSTPSSTTNSPSKNMMSSGTPKYDVRPLNSPYYFDQYPNPGQSVKQEYEVQRAVSDILTNVSFGTDVIEDRVPEMLPYHKQAERFAIDLPNYISCLGYEKQRRLRNSRGCGGGHIVSHMPCFLKGVREDQHPHGPDNSKGAVKRVSPVYNTKVCDRLVEISESCPFEDEKFLSNLSPSTIELIVGRMTGGGQQERLRKKFNLPTTEPAKPDTIPVSEVKAPRMQVGDVKAPKIQVGDIVDRRVRAESIRSQSKA